MNADDLARILDELGKRLGPTGEYVFQLAVRQVIVESIAWIVCTGIAAVLLWAGARLVWWAMRTNPEDNDLVVLTCFLAVVATVAFVVAIGLNGVHLLNPEFAAIEKILGAVR